MCLDDMNVWGIPVRAHIYNVGLISSSGQIESILEALVTYLWK
jgi:hypothetical protein